MNRELPVLPGWQNEIGVDFSDYKIDGTNCLNCRSLTLGAREPTASDPRRGDLRCMSPDFIKSAILKQGKEPGDDRIPVKSGLPWKYCCNFWALARSAAAE